MHKDEILRYSLSWAQSLPRLQGRAELIKFLKGEKLTRGETLKALCFRCSSGWNTRKGCTVHDCPAIAYAPYQEGDGSGESESM